MWEIFYEKVGGNYQLKNFNENLLKRLFYKYFFAALTYGSVKLQVEIGLKQVARRVNTLIYLAEKCLVCMQLLHI